MRISEIKLCSYFEIHVKTMYTVSLIQTVVSGYGWKFTSYGCFKLNNISDI